MSTPNHDNVKSSGSRNLFPPIVDGKINTEEFLEACREVVKIYESLGKLFSPAKNDVLFNIEKVNKCYQTDKVKNATLHDMILKEKEDGKDIVEISLLWLTRGLHFLQVIFENLFETFNMSDQNSENLYDIISNAYSVTLRPYHGWINQQAILLALRLSPSRTTLVESLRGTSTVEQLVDEMKTFIRSLKINIIELHRFYNQFGSYENHVV